MEDFLNSHSNLQLSENRELYRISYIGCMLKVRVTYFNVIYP